MVNLCRDEVTVSLKHRIEQIFGSSFSTNGLGGVLTCGVTGLGAGFSHSPLCSSNKERYVFFSLPHIRWHFDWLDRDQLNARLMSLCTPFLAGLCTLLSPCPALLPPAASTPGARLAPCPAPAAPASPAPAAP